MSNSPESHVPEAESIQLASNDTLKESTKVAASSTGREKLKYKSYLITEQDLKGLDHDKGEALIKSKLTAARLSVPALREGAKAASNQVLAKVREYLKHKKADPTIKKELTPFAALQSDQFHQYLFAITAQNNAQGSLAIPPVRLLSALSGATAIRELRIGTSINDYIGKEEKRYANGIDIMDLESLLSGYQMFDFRTAASTPNNMRRLYDKYWSELKSGKPAKFFDKSREAESEYTDQYVAEQLLDDIA